MNLLDSFFFFFWIKYFDSQIIIIIINNSLQNHTTTYNNKKENLFHLQCTSSFYSNAHTSWPCEWTWCSLMAINMISNDAIGNVFIHKKKFTFADPNRDINVNFPLLQPPIREKRVEELGKWVRKEIRVCGCCCFRFGLVCCRT